MVTGCLTVTGFSENPFFSAEGHHFLTESGDGGGRGYRII
jgi:hypothetical protein